VRDIETADSELRLVAALRRAARERGGPLPSIDVADALLDERRELSGGHPPCPEVFGGRFRGNTLWRNAVGAILASISAIGIGERIGGHPQLGGLV
jgi:hypothetical protein